MDHITDRVRAALLMRGFGAGDIPPVWIRAVMRVRERPMVGEWQIAGESGESGTA